MTQYAISIPNCSEERAECRNIKEARIEAFNRLQMLAQGFSARIHRLSSRGRVDMGYVSDDGLWTKEEPPGGRFYDSASASEVVWRPICTSSPIMFSVGEPRWYFDAELFTRESVHARMPRVMHGPYSGIEISEVSLRPTFSEDAALCWEISDSDRSHRFWEVIVDGTA